MKKFCYWQEDVPEYLQIQYLIELKKICLFRQNEFELDKKTNIFCPFSSAEKAEEECLEYRVSKQFYE